MDKSFTYRIFDTKYNSRSWGYIVNTILGFICRMVFVKCLAADYLGVNGLFTNILTMLSLAELGIGGTIVYALYKPLAENDERKIASLVKVYGTAYKVIGCVIGIIGICLMPFFKYNYYGTAKYF